MTENNGAVGITLLGLGPGDPALLTREAWDWLQNAPQIVLRSRRHPVAASLPAGVQVIALDALIAGDEDPEVIHQRIIAKVIELGKRPPGVTYAVSGHPLIGEAASPEIISRAKSDGIPVQIVAGLSLLDTAFTALGLDPFPQTAIVDALELSRLHMPSFPPSAPALIGYIDSVSIAEHLKQVLLQVYPPDHPLTWLLSPGMPDQRLERLQLSHLGQNIPPGQLALLYVPSHAKGSSFEDFQELVAHLRAPDGCPWDRKQTHQSLRSHLLAETYEALEALDNGDNRALAEELGDLLLQIVLHTQIAVETGEFKMVDVIGNIHRKIVYRHPHVFGDTKVEGVGGVLANWEKLKAAEREASGGEKLKGLLDGVPVHLPALTQAHEIQERAARVGFDWPEIQGVIEKIFEELQEVENAPDPEALAGEIGDLCFAVVNLARWKNVDAESALRQTNTRFRRRFAHIENAARQAGHSVADLSFEELDGLWEAAKRDDDLS